MNARDAATKQMKVEGSDVAEANYPLWFFVEFCKINVFDDTRTTITTAGTNNRLDLRFIDHALKILQTFFV
jgi:hypothetical protein